MQFGINKHEQIFQRLQKIARARRASAICSLWKICECLFIPNCTRKIIWLLVNTSDNFCHASVFYVTNEGHQLLQLYWMKIWQVNSRVKTHSLSSSRAVSFNCQKQSLRYSQLNIEELDHKAKEKLPSLRIRCGFLAKCISSGWETVSRVYAEKKLFNSAQVA